VIRFLCLLATISASTWNVRAAADEAFPPIAEMIILFDGPVQVRQCDGTMKFVGVSMREVDNITPVKIEDIDFSLDATDWDRARAQDLLDWAAHCFGRPCWVGDRYDPPMPPMKCAATS